MKKQPFLLRFLIRWVVCGLGLWVAAGLLGGERMHLGGGGTSTSTAVILAGLLLALVNMFLKPILIFLSIPALLLSLGLFMLIVNGLLITLVSWLYSPLYVRSFGVAVVAGIIVGLVNYLVSRILEDIR